MPVVGILHDRPAGPSTAIRGLQEGLRRFGYVDGQTIKFEIRFAGGKRDDLPNLARDLVQRKVDVVFAIGGATLKAARDATDTMPIVTIDLETDPVAVGYARSVGQPGGNVTGLFLDQPTLAAKWLQLIRTVVPGISRVALLHDPRTGPWQLAAAKAMGQQLGIDLQILEVKTQNYSKLEWVVGPYAKLSECEQDRDRMANVIGKRVVHPNALNTTAPGVVMWTDSSKDYTIRLFCVPDSVNPRVDPRWR